MAFGSRGQFKRGGKKGPRQNDGKGRAGVTLRPAPAVDASAARQRSVSPERPWLDEEDEDEEEQISYETSLRRERKPLEGLCVTISGCGREKGALFELAKELGGTSQPSLTTDTTHLVADNHGSAKYDMAVEKKLQIMLPSWLPAVREAWTSAAKIDWEELHENHRYLQLHGTVICLTQFEPGTYKRSLQESVIASGGQVANTLAPGVTHLVLPAPDAEHRQPKPDMKKITFARKNLHVLPRLQIVWEGWLLETMRIGGRLSGREAPEVGEGAFGRGTWTWVDGGRVPRELPDFPTEDRQPSEGSSKGKGKARSLEVQDTLVVNSAQAAPAHHKKRPRDLNDTLLDDSEELLPARRALPSTLARSRTVHEVDDLLQEFSTQRPGPAASSSRAAGAWATTEGQNIEEARAASLALRKQKETRMEMEANGDEVFGAMGKKGVGLISGYKNARTFEMGDQTSAPKPPGALKRSSTGGLFGATSTSTGAAARSDDAVGAGAADDSGFLETLSAFVDKAPAPQQPQSSEDSEPDLPIFVGLTFSLMGMKEGNRDNVQKGIEKRGGVVRIDEGAEKGEGGSDWIVVEYFGAPKEWIDSGDDRVVTGCWVEYCIVSDGIVPPSSERLLDRPLPYDIPVPGAEKLKIHSSTFDDIETVHLKRFITDIGGTFSRDLDPSCSHLLHGGITSSTGLLEDGPKPEGNTLKIEKALEWGVEVRGVEWLKNWAASGGDKAQSKKEGSTEHELKEVTNVDGGRRSRSAVEESLKPEGPLLDCTILFSSKIDRNDHHRLLELLTSLGASQTKSFSPSVTHLLHIGSRQNETFADFKKARAAQVHIVHPEWLEKCASTEERLHESDFPHTLDPRKGGQLAGLVASPPRRDSIGSQPMSRGPSKNASQGMAKSHSRQEQEIAIPPRLDPRAFDAILAEKQGAPNGSQGRVQDDEDVTMEPQEEDLGGMDPLDQRQDVFEEAKPHPSPSPSPKKSQAVAQVSPPPQSRALFTSSPGPSSPPPQSRRPPQHVTSDAADQSSDPLVPPPAKDEPTKLLKEQTSLLLAQLGAAVPSKGANSRILRKRSDNSETSLSKEHSLSDVSARSAPALLPGMANRQEPRRIPGYGPSQHTQGGPYGEEDDDEESMYVTFDDPHERQEREKIQQLLAGGSGGGATAAAGAENGQVHVQDSARKRRAREREIRQDEEENESYEGVTPNRKRSRR